MPKTKRTKARLATMDAVSARHAAEGLAMLRSKEFNAEVDADKARRAREWAAAGHTPRCGFSCTEDCQSPNKVVDKWVVNQTRRIFGKGGAK